MNSPVGDETNGDTSNMINETLNKTEYPADKNDPTKPAPSIKIRN